MMGSGGMIVMDDRDCVVDVASYFIEIPWRRNPAANACPAVLGLKAHVANMLERFTNGEGSGQRR
jgi:NADP-reducing hydrogenase subunit HndC